MYVYTNQWSWSYLFFNKEHVEKQTPLKLDRPSFKFVFQYNFWLLQNQHYHETFFKQNMQESWQLYFFKMEKKLELHQPSLG